MESNTFIISPAVSPAQTPRPPRSAGFPTCRIADSPIGRPPENSDAPPVGQPAIQPGRFQDSVGDGVTRRKSLGNRRLRTPRPAAQPTHPNRTPQPNLFRPCTGRRSAQRADPTMPTACGRVVALRRPAPRPAAQRATRNARHNQTRSGPARAGGQRSALTLPRLRELVFRRSGLA